jgi:hypothetical protein
MDRAIRSGDESRVEPPHLWTVPEANARLPSLGELLLRLRGWVTRLGEVQGEAQRLGAFWGSELEASDHADHDIKERLDAEARNLTRRIEESLAALRAEGIEVKNLETGLFDFYGLHDGEVVFLCWQQGEPEVAFFHPLTGGFRNRRPLSERGRPTPARSRSSL